MSTRAGKRLRDARLGAGLTQEELGQRAGLSQRLLSAIERGYRAGTLQRWQQLAKALNVSVTWLTEGEDVAESEDDGAETILRDENSPPGLRDLASDGAIVETLAMTDAEWRALRSLEAPGLLSREAYLAVLFSIRSGLQ